MILFGQICIPVLCLIGAIFCFIATRELKASGYVATKLLFIILGLALIGFGVFMGIYFPEFFVTATP